VLGAWQREVLAEFDIRNAQAFPGAVEANADGTVTLGRYSQVTDQRTLPQVSAGNRLSAQNINPLGSTGSALTASITVQAHTLHYGFGSVSYNGGTISGLTPDVLYYVYADDPDFEGGAVSYSASTAGTSVVANNGRYYVGAIETASAASSGNVAAASSANPIEITTSSAHGFTNGEEVEFSDMPGDFAALNGNAYTITYVDADSFTIAVNGAGFAAYAGPAGTVTRVSTPTSGGSGGGFEWNIP
jgi:hypothetical protein